VKTQIAWDRDKYELPDNVEGFMIVEAHETIALVLYAQKRR